MLNIHIATTSTVKPQDFLAALTDFSERRPTLWPNLDPGFYKVHATGPNWAEVTEGSNYPNGVWERDRYDWSQPGKVRIEVLDSNAFVTGSFWEYQVALDGNGGSRVEMTLHRTGKGIKGRVLTAFLRVVGRKFFSQSLDKTFAHIAQVQATGRK